MAGSKGGRPPFEITEKVVAQIEQLAGYGLTIRQIAAVIDCDERTLYRRKADEEAVLSAFEKGKAKAQGIIGKSLFERAKAGSETAIIWWEKTRAGRYGVPTQDHDDGEGSPKKFIVEDHGNG